MEQLYLSIDVEADGPCAGINSMLSLGIAGFTVDKGIVFEWEKNMFPLSGCTADKETMKWWSKKENDVAFKYVLSNRVSAQNAFVELFSKIRELKKTYEITVVGWPINYDWQWINYYFHRFVKQNPLGFSARCIASYGWGKTGSKTIDYAKFADPKYQHTHKALDDAKEQGALFINLLCSVCSVQNETDVA